MITICKIFRFEAAHSLPNYKGSCSKIHGHSYKLEVMVSGEIREEGIYKGMVMDFSKLKRIVTEKIINQHDHSYLNNIYPNPTAESMVFWIGNTLKLFLPKYVVLSRVRLWETENSWAEWRSE